MLGDGNCVRVLTGHSGRVRAVAVSTNGQELYSGGEDGVILKWDAETGEKADEFEGHDCVVWTLVLSPDDSILYSGSADCTVRAWDIGTGGCIQIINQHRGWVRALALSPSKPPLDHASLDNTTGKSKLFTGSLDWFIESRDIRSNQILHRIPSGTGRLDLIHALAVSENGKMLFSGGTGCIVRAWCTETAESLKSFQGHTDTVFTLAVTKHGGGRLWSASGDHTIRAWRPSDAQCIQIIPTEGVTYSLCTSTDLQSLFSAPYKHNRIAVWRVDDNVGLVRRASRELDLNDDASLPLIASPADCTLSGHLEGEAVCALAMSAASGTLFSASGDLTVRGWQVGVPQCWSRRAHKQYPQRFRDAAKTVLLAINRGNQEGNERSDQSINLLHEMWALEPSLIDNVVGRLAEFAQLGASRLWTQSIK